MKQRPMFFIPLMVEQILVGRKTQTRRKADMTSRHIRKLFNGEFEGESGRIYKCPYGQVGDVLWVKETFYAYGHWDKNGTTKTGKQKWKFVRDKKGDVKFEWKADTLNVLRKNSFRGLGWYKRSALFMEQDMARIWLRITNVRVERLQDISEEDAKAEGIEEFTKDGVGLKYGIDGWHWSCHNGFPFMCNNVEFAFEVLWSLINGHQSWEDNPWVWVIEFERIEKPIE